MSTDRNKALVAEFIEIVNRRDLDALDRVVAPDFVRHSHSTPGVAVADLDAFRGLLESDAAAFSDARQEIRLMLAEGPYVSVLVAMEGTQDGPMGPHPATGRRFSTEFISILRVEEGRIAEAWIEWDNLSLMAQLGLGPGATGEGSVP